MIRIADTAATDIIIFVDKEFFGIIISFSDDIFDELLSTGRALCACKFA